MVLFLLGPISVFAAKIVIVTDQQNGKKAQELKSLFQKTPPFSLMKPLEIQIEKVAVGVVKCREGRTLNDRIIDCYQDQLRAISLKTNADRVIFVKEDAKYGGAGGFYALTTTGSPVAIGMHEFLHYYGFSDEYPYSEREAIFYCELGRLKSGPNLAVFDDKPPYKSDADAKTLHAAVIPWSAAILPTTAIVTGTKLGSPTKKGTGLFPAGVCPKSPKTWKPEDSENIMSSPNSVHIPQATWADLANRMQVQIEMPKAPPQQLRATRLVRSYVDKSAN